MNTKRKMTYLIIAVAMIALVVAPFELSVNPKDNVGAKIDEGLPFDIYETKDSDGCEYIVVQDDTGDGIAIQLKLSQTELACVWNWGETK